MNDEETIQVLAIENGKLQEQVKQLGDRILILKEEIEGVRGAMRGLRRLERWKSIFSGAMGITLILSLLALLLYPLGMYFFAQKAGNCYVERGSLYLGRNGNAYRDAYTLRRTIDWGEDRFIGVFSSLEEAVKKAQVLGCKME